MKSYAITGAPAQPPAIDKLKTSGAKVIQSSNGLICKTNQSIEELKNLTGGQVEAIEDPSTQTPDIKKFLTT